MACDLTLSDGLVPVISGAMIVRTVGRSDPQQIASWCLETQIGRETLLRHIGLSVFLCMMRTASARQMILNLLQRPTHG